MVHAIFFCKSFAMTDNLCHVISAQMQNKDVAQPFPTRSAAQTMPVPYKPVVKSRKDLQTLARSHSLAQDSCPHDLRNPSPNPIPPILQTAHGPNSVGFPKSRAIKQSLVGSAGWNLPSKSFAFFRSPRNFVARKEDAPRTIEYVDPGTGWDKDFATSH